MDYRTAPKAKGEESGSAIRSLGNNSPMMAPPSIFAKKTNSPQKSNASKRDTLIYFEHVTYLHLQARLQTRIVWMGRHVMILPIWLSTWTCLMKIWTNRNEVIVLSSS